MIDHQIKKEIKREVLVCYYPPVFGRSLGSSNKPFLRIFSNIWRVALKEICHMNGCERSVYSPWRKG